MRETLQEELQAVSQWLGRTRDDVRSYGARGAVVGLQRLFWQGSLRVVGKHVYNYGTPVYDSDWDLLVVLDACRPDLMAEVAGEYSFLPDEIPTACSIGTHTTEWMAKTFADANADAMRDTAYVVGNPQSAKYTDEDDWAALEEPWRFHRSDDGAIPPRAVTDAAISTIRSTDASRVIVHYMQPHQPFRTFDDSADRAEKDDVWEALRFGEFDREEVWTAYRDNLRWVLDDVELLLRSVDASRAIITSDHGNTLGEWGIYGHPEYMPLDVLKRVPWVETSAKNDGSYTPTYSTESVVTDDADVEDRLKDLGYV